MNVKSDNSRNGTVHVGVGNDPDICIAICGASEDYRIWSPYKHLAWHQTDEKANCKRCLKIEANK